MDYLFVTGTRADFGKLKPLIKILSKKSSKKVVIVATGMHLLKEFGDTILEIKKSFKGSIISIPGQKFQENMSIGLSRFILNFNNYIKENRANLVIVHGDRFDALGAAIVASNLGIHVLHIEGGEVSGTIDEAIRHSISKFSHVHMVSNEKSKKRVIQLGENPDHIHVTGSPETDILLNTNLPSIKSVKFRYNIKFKKYYIFCFHPVVTELEEISDQIDTLIKFADYLSQNIIWIYPNNDKGSDIIIERLKNIENKNIRIFDSIRFENYITLLKYSSAIIGNSSSGVREAPVLGVPCINLGSRQENRVISDFIFESEFDLNSLINVYKKMKSTKFKNKHDRQFGEGNVAKKIFKILDNIKLENIPIQKKFHEQ